MTAPTLTPFDCGWIYGEKDSPFGRYSPDLALIRWAESVAGRPTRAQARLFETGYRQAFHPSPIQLAEHGTRKLRLALNGIRGNYYLVAAAEPVLQLLEPGVCWVVEGRYGPTLVSRNLAVWDVDSIEGIDGCGIAFNTLPPPSDEKVLLIVRDRLQRKAIQGSFRIYRTFGGVRVICTSQTYDGTDGWFVEVGEALRADPAYMQISARQKCSRARLKPKSAELRISADKGTGPRRACQFIGCAGSDGWLDSITDQIDFHDRETQATHTENLRLY